MVEKQRSMGKAELCDDDGAGRGRRKRREGGQGAEGRHRARVSGWMTELSGYEN